MREPIGSLRELRGLGDRAVNDGLSVGLLFSSASEEMAGSTLRHSVQLRRSASMHDAAGYSASGLIPFEGFEKQLEMRVPLILWDPILNEPVDKVGSMEVIIAATTSTEDLQNVEVEDWNNPTGPGVLRE